MSFQSSNLLALQRINIDCIIFRPSGNVFITYEMYTKYGIGMISFYSFNSIQSDLFTPSCDTSLLVGSYVVEFVVFLYIFTWFYVLHGAILSVGAGGLWKIGCFDFC